MTFRTIYKDVITINTECGLQAGKPFQIFGKCMRLIINEPDNANNSTSG